MATLTVTTLDHITPVTWPATPGQAADTTNGDLASNGGSTILVMNNTAGSAGTCTVETSATVDGLPVGDRQFTVPANTIQLVKLGPVSVYGTTTKITCSAATMRVAAYAV
jgi:hypothetical protein